MSNSLTGETYFVEEVEASRYLRLVLSSSKCRYGKLTLSAKILDMFLAKVHLFPVTRANIQPLEWGDTRYLTGLVSSASRHAFQQADNFMEQAKAFIVGGDKIFSVPFRKLFGKYLAAKVLYKKYFYYELVLRFIEENQITNCAFVLSSFSKPYEEAFSKKGKVLVEKEKWGFFYLSICVIGIFFIMTKMWRLREPERPAYQEKLVCLVHSGQELRAYKRLLGHGKAVRYVVLPGYRQYLNEDEAKEVQVLKGIRPYQYPEIFREGLRFIRFLFQNRALLKDLKEEPLRFFWHLQMGRMMAPDGRGNLIMTFEHHDTLKTIRNEFIKSYESESLFFPYLTGFALRYYPDEFNQNYQYVGMSGEYLRDHFRENRGSCKEIYPIGSYTRHRPQDEETKAGNKSFVDRSLAQKGGDIAISVLSPGICKPTYYSEVFLMDLALQLAKEDGIKIFLRRKPVECHPSYQGFYERYAEESSSFLITGLHEDLYDFLHFTDLFLTTYSTSGFDVAMRGGKVYFIDVLKQGDRFIAWEKDKIGSLLLGKEEAFEKIMAWVNDPPDGKIRYNHAQDMKKIRDYMEYSFPDFESYRNNFLNQLRKSIFQHRKAFQDI